MAWPVALTGTKDFDVPAGFVVCEFLSVSQKGFGVRRAPGEPGYISKVSHGSVGKGCEPV